MLISSVVEAIRYRRCHRIVIFFPLWTFLTPVLIGIVIQSLIYGVSLGWCCTAIGLASLYMSMQNELAYKDSLTGLHNRQYMDRILNTWNGRSGIMVDMDYFKEINDRFGHSVGDRALKDTADLLVANSPENSIVIRFAGDEFILLLSTGQEILIQKVEENIRKAADEFNRTADRPYKISLSMGHALYEKKGEDSFLEAMDSAMYRDKRIRHASGELRDRRQSARPEP
jgi:diguanylate cyclase (GGDEF)-like protein